jgi:hypothetical protein
MGADRKSTVQQQIYLQAMATNFQKITDHALDAYYARNPIFAESLEMRLPTLVVDRSDKFAAELAKKGHTVGFDIEDDKSKEDIGNSDSDGDGEKSDSDVEESDFEPIDESIRDSSDGEANTAATPSTHKDPELSNLFPDEGNTPEPQHRHILDWIEDEYRKARGSGLQVISPAVLPILWQQQSNNWRAMMMEHVCQEERTRSELMAILLERFIDQYKVAINHVEFLLEVELDGTQKGKRNHRFHSYLRARRFCRLTTYKAEYLSSLKALAWLNLAFCARPFLSL